MAAGRRRRLFSLFGADPSLTQLLTGDGATTRRWHQGMAAPKHTGTDPAPALAAGCHLHARPGSLWVEIRLQKVKKIVWFLKKIHFTKSCEAIAQ